MTFLDECIEFTGVYWKRYLHHPWGGDFEKQGVLAGPAPTSSRGDYYVF